jgi:hypothetical protein
MFYTFTQNNSGGLYTGPAKYFIVEAEFSQEANEIAQNHGIYFNGCASGADCECCGDRWYPCSSSDGTKKPEIYGNSPEEARKEYRLTISPSNSIPYAVVVYKKRSAVAIP